MKKSGLLVLVTLLVLAYSQNEWQTEWIQWPQQLNQTTLGYCSEAFPAPYDQYCKTCQPGLIQYSNVWYFPCQLPTYKDYCISSDWHLNCLLCTNGYYVKYNVATYGFNECWSKKLGCSVYDDINKNCKTCTSEYVMNTTLNFWGKPENYCVFVPEPNCQTFAADGMTCIKCLNGFFLSNKKCNANIVIPNCEISNGRICSKCVAGYQSTQFGTCFLIPKIKNCVIQDLSVCKKCDTNYQLDVNGICVIIPLISNCLSQIDYTCNNCVNGYILVKNQCKYITPNNCIEVLDNKCTKCQNLYILDSFGTCTYAPTIANCADQVGLKCISCNSNYILNNEVCKYYIENCVTISDNICTLCFEGFFNVDGRCVAQTIIYDLNCRKYDQVSIVGKCIECSQGFFLSDAKCLQVDPLCNTYDLKTGFCLTCYVGYKLNELNGRCLLAPVDESALAHCNQFDYVKNICVKCAEGSAFDLAGKCQKILDLYCKIPSADLQSCNQCYNGYYYDNTAKKCTVSQLNCLAFNNQGTCASCPNGFALDPVSLSCNILNQYCKSFNPTTKKCSQCYQGYGLNADSICKDINTLPAETKKFFLNCAKFDINGSCSECYFRWFLTRDATGTYCQPVSDSCRTHHPKTGLCITCYLGYYLINGTCQKFI